MGFDWSSYAISHYDGVNAHFAVLRRGAVIQLHDVTDYMPASHRFNRRAIAIGFEGSPRSTGASAFMEGKIGAHEPTLSQIFAGRALLQKLKAEHRIAHVFAHRQAYSPGRGNCRGVRRHERGQHPHGGVTLVS
jgi:hypothetical protein